MEPPHDDRLSILFLCTGNSCRSQMAEGWARHVKLGTIEAHSAGTQPQGLNPLAVAAMAEVGVDISSHTSKSVEDLVKVGVTFDIVVTVCSHAHETCPTFAGMGAGVGDGDSQPRIVHVGFDDPPRLAKNEKTEADALKHYRRVRDEIRAFVIGLPESLENEHGTTVVN